MKRFAAFLAIAVLAAACGSGDRPDPDFDTHVADPAYPNGGPLVLFDEAHHNVHTAAGKYRPFAQMIASDGYKVDRGKRKIDARALKGYAVLVVANALGTNEKNDDPAFEPAECDAIHDWVAAGGSLLLITDHWPTGTAVEGLATKLGVRLSLGEVEDEKNFDPAFDSTHVIHSRDNGGVAAHPIVDGRNAGERVERVLTFTGSGVAADPPAASFLPLSASAVARPAQPQVERKGGDVIVKVAYGDPVPATGWSQGVALELGKGRIVVLGEAAMLTATLSGYDGHALGMSVPGYDNRKLALNVMHWLTRLI